MKSLKTGSSSGAAAAAGSSYLAAGGDKQLSWETIAEEVDMADLVMLVETAHRSVTTVIELLL